MPHPCQSSPVAPAHKRARSVDTGRTAQQHGPPCKLSKSRSAEHLASPEEDRPPGSHSSADYRASDDDSSVVSSDGPPTSPVSSSSAPDRPAEPSAGPAPRVRVKPAPATGVLLVSESFTEINAGLVIILKSMHTCPVAYDLLREPTRDSDELAETVTHDYHQRVERYLATTSPPTDVEAAVSSGLLASPLLGTWTEFSVDWCHAWSILGQWSSWVTFPVPKSGQWPRHGHLRGIAEGYKGRQPNFHKWARPAFEQGALPTLSLLQGAVAVRFLYQGTRSTRRWRLSTTTCGQSFSMDLVLVPSAECRSGYVTLQLPAYCQWQFHFLARRVGARNGCTLTFYL